MINWKNESGKKTENKRNFSISPEIDYLLKMLSQKTASQNISQATPFVFFIIPGEEWMESVHAFGQNGPRILYSNGDGLCDRLTVEKKRIFWLSHEKSTFVLESVFHVTKLSNTIIWKKSNKINTNPNVTQWQKYKEWSIDGYNSSKSTNEF